MVYRKGELSKKTIDQRWPHQVALEARFCMGHNYWTLRYFCEGLSLCDRSHGFVREGKDYVVFCFAKHDHAERFSTRFRGELMHATERPKWPAG